MESRDTKQTFKFLAKAAFPAAKSHDRLWKLTETYLCAKHSPASQNRIILCQKWICALWEEYLRVYESTVNSSQLQVPPPIHFRKPPSAAIWKEIAVSYIRPPLPRSDPFVGPGPINGGLTRRQTTQPLSSSRVVKIVEKVQRRFTWVNIAEAVQASIQPSLVLSTSSQLPQESPSPGYGSRAGQASRYEREGEPLTPTKQRRHSVENLSRLLNSAGDRSLGRSHGIDDDGRQGRRARFDDAIKNDGGGESEEEYVSQRLKSRDVSPKSHDKSSDGEFPKTWVTGIPKASPAASSSSSPEQTPASYVSTPNRALNTEENTPLTIPDFPSSHHTQDGPHPDAASAFDQELYSDFKSDDSTPLVDDTPCKPPKHRASASRRRPAFTRTNKTDPTSAIENDEEVEDAKIDVTLSGGRQVKAEPRVFLYYYDEQSKNSMRRLQNELTATCEFPVPVELHKCNRKRTTAGRSHPLAKARGEPWSGDFFRKAQEREDTKLLKELLDCLEKPVHFEGSRKKGSIYGFTRADARPQGDQSDGSLGFIKIGKGDVDPEQRFNVIRDNCGYEPTILFHAVMPWAAKVLETLIHLDLDKYRHYDSSCKEIRQGKQLCTSKHIEWFEVDLKTALETVIKWQRFSACQPFFSEGYLNGFWQREVRDAQLERLKRAREEQISPGISGGWTKRMLDALKRLDAGENHVNLGEITMKVRLVDGQECSLLELHSSQHLPGSLLADTAASVATSLSSRMNGIRIG